MRDPNMPTAAGWYRCLVDKTMDRPERWAAIEVLDDLQAVHFGSTFALDWKGFLEWGAQLEVEPPGMMT